MLHKQRMKSRYPLEGPCKELILRLNVGGQQTSTLSWWLWAETSFGVSGVSDVMAS